MQKIYCVEDDESVRELVIYALQSSGFEAQGLDVYKRQPLIG